MFSLVNVISEMKRFLSQINILRLNCTLYCDKTTFHFGKEGNRMYRNEWIFFISGMTSARTTNVNLPWRFFNVRLIFTTNIQGSNSLRMHEVLLYVLIYKWWIGLKVMSNWNKLIQFHLSLIDKWSVACACYVLYYWSLI